MFILIAAAIIVLSQQVLGNCDETCFQLQTNPSLVPLRTDCDCTKQRRTKKQNEIILQELANLEASPVFFEPAVTYHPQFDLPRFRTAFRIHNPSSITKKLVNEGKTGGRETNHYDLSTVKEIETQDYSIKEMDVNKNQHYLGKNNDSLKKRKHNAGKNYKRDNLSKGKDNGNDIAPFYIDIDVKNSEHTRISNHYQHYKDFDFTEENVEKCIDLHIVVFLRKTNNETQSSDMWEREDIKRYKNYTNEELDSAIEKKCNKLSAIMEQSLNEVKHSWVKNHYNHTQDSTEKASVTELKNLNINAKNPNALLSTLSKPTTYNKLTIDQINFTTNKEQLDNIVDPNKVYQTNSRTADIRNNNSEISDWSLLESKDFDGKESQLSYKVITTEEPANKDIIEFTTSDDHSVFTSFIYNDKGISEDQPHKLSTIVSSKMSDNLTKNVGVENVELNDSESKVKQPYLFRTFSTETPFLDNSTLPAISNHHSDPIKENLMNERDFFFPSTTVHLPTNKEHSYNHSDTKILRIITKELSNNTVISDISGNEPESYEPSNTDENYFPPINKNNNDMTKPTFEDIVINNTTKQTEHLKLNELNGTQKIEGKLYFIFNEMSLPAQFVQGSDGKLNIGFDGNTLCDKLKRDDPSLLISTICKCINSTQT